MDEYISKQRAKDLMGCCLASAKAEYKAAKDVFRKARFEDYMLAMRSMIDVVGSVESADVQPVNQWISAKDRLPDEDGWYLVCKHNRVRVAEWCKDCWYNESDLPIDYCTITYWQPLPEPPKDGEHND